MGYRERNTYLARKVRAVVYVPQLVEVKNQMIGLVIPLTGFSSEYSHRFAQLLSTQANADVSVPTKEFDGTNCACLSVLWTFHQYLSEKDFNSTIHALMHLIHIWFNVTPEVITVRSSLELQRRVS